MKPLKFWCNSCKKTITSGVYSSKRKGTWVIFCRFCGLNALEVKKVYNYKCKQCGIPIRPNNLSGFCRCCYLQAYRDDHSAKTPRKTPQNTIKSGNTKGKISINTPSKSKIERGFYL